MNTLLELSQSKNTVFTFDELQQIFGIKNIQVFKNKLARYTKNGILERLSRGVYGLKNKIINTFELANKIYSPSYLSFFTALYHHGMIFQYEEGVVYLAYKKSDIKNMSLIKIHLKSLKKEILLNPSGITNNGIFSIAGPERAFLDTIYLYKDIHFDNISSLNQDTINELLPVYNSKTLEKRVKSYFLNSK